MHFKSRRLLLSFWCTLLAAATPVTAHAYCVGWDRSLPDFDPNYYSVPKEFARATFVVKVRVVRETWLGDDGKEQPLEPPFQGGASRPFGFDPYMGAFYDVRVLTSFKGHPPGTMRLFSENSTGRFQLDVGSDLVLFVGEGRFDPPVGEALTVDNCGNSTLVQGSGDLLDQVRKLSKPASR